MGGAVSRCGALLAGGAKARRPWRLCSGDGASLVHRGRTPRDDDVGYLCTTVLVSQVALPGSQDEILLKYPGRTRREANTVRYHGFRRACHKLAFQLDERNR